MGRLFLSLFMLCVITIGILWLGIGLFPDGESKSSLATANEGQKKSMSQSIEEKAQRARGADENSIRELADAVLSNANIKVIPTDILDNMKERLIRAELKYRNGKRGIHESAVVQLINNLADKFRAPDYAKTSPLQVRTLRVHLQRRLPSFIAQSSHEERKGLEKKVGERMNPEMSPLEAAYVTAILIWQKMLNEDWQETPEKWTPDSLNQRSADSDANAKPQLSSIGVREKASEMSRVITHGTARLESASVRDLIDTSLEIIGIEKEEQR